MKEYQFEWANGTETIKGKSVEDACSKIKTKVNKIETGVLVRVRQTTGKQYETVWKYWDCIMFWKHLRKK